MTDNVVTIDIRLVNADGTLGEVLPEWETFEYQDVPDDVGVVTMTYPPDGVRSDLIQAKQEFAICLDGSELPNGRFRFDQAQGDPIRDTMGNLTWAGLTLLNRLAEADVVPLTDSAALQDVLTAEERKWYDAAVSAARSQWQKDAADAMKEYREKYSDWKLNPKGLEPEKPEETNFDEQLEGLLDTRFVSAPAPVAPLFVKATPGKVLLDLFRAAQDRGAIPELSVGFTATKDSKGVSWPKTITQRFDVGQSLLQVAQWLTENEYAEARMVGRRLDLYAYDDEARYTGTDRTAVGVLLAYGKNLVDGPRVQDYREMVNALYAVSDTGVHGWVTDPERIKRDGRIEGMYSGTGQKTWKELHDAAMQVINSYGDGKEERTYGLVGDDAVPYRDFGVGDSVLVLEGEYPEPMTVKAITLTVDNAGVARWAVTLNDRILDDVEKAALRLQSMIGNTAATMGGAGLLTYQSPGMFADGSAPTQPSAPQVVTGSGSAQFSYDGTDVNGAPAIWDQDHVQLHISTEADYLPDFSTLYDPYVYGSTTLPNLPYNTPLYAKFVAVDAGGDTSMASEPVSFTVAPPSAPTSDGFPPNTAPTVEVVGGLGYVQLLWDQVENADLTWYQVHCSTTQGFSYGPGTLVHVGPDSSFTLREYSAAPLVYGTTYYFRVVPQDEDGVGPQSSEVSGSPVQITSPDIAVGQVWAGQAYIDNLIGGTLREDLVVGSKITTRPGDEGAGVELSLEGMMVYGPDGAPKVILPSDLAPGNPAVFKGDVEAETLTATALTLRGTANEFEKGSNTVLAAGVTAPTQAPASNANWKSLALGFDMASVGSIRGIWWRSDLGMFEVATAFNATGFLTLNRLTTSGALDSQVEMGSFGSDEVWRVHSAVLGGTRYWWVITKPTSGEPKFRQYTYTGGNYVQTYSVTYSRLKTDRWPGLGDDGTYPVIGDMDVSNDRWRMSKRSLSDGTNQSYTYLSWGSQDQAPVTNLYGTFGSNFGSAARWMITGQGDNIVPHSGSGTPSATEVFPKAAYGWLVWDGSNFWSLHNLSPTLYRYENGNLLTDVSSGTSQDWWTGYTWRDTIGTTHETDCVNAAKFTMARRKRVTVNMPPLPPGTGGADDVNAVGVYLGKGATKPERTALWLQAVSATELCANGNFETNVDGWGSNPAYGAYVPSTVARSGTRAHLNSYSMLVTEPTLAQGEKTWADMGAVSFVAGAQYRLRAWVYVPTGSPDVKWDVVFYASQPDSEYATTKDAWVELDWTYTDPGGPGGKFPGIQTRPAGVGGQTSGKQFWVDDVRITPVDAAEPVHITDGTFSGTNPPASSSFGAEDPAGIEVGTTDSDGAIFHVHGDGSGRWGPFTFGSGGALTTGAVDQVVAAGTRTNADTSITAETLEFVTGAFAAEAGARYKVEVNVPVANNTAGNYTRVRARIDTSATGVTGTEVAECVVDNRVAGRREGAHIVGAYWDQGSDQTLYGKVTVWPSNNTTTCSFDLSPGFIVITKIG